MKVSNLYSDNGYCGSFKNRGNWWFDPTFEHSFEIFDLDSLYPAQYFKKNDFPINLARGFTLVLCAVYKRITGRGLRSILEAGCAAGWFTKELKDIGVKEIVALEGSKAGVERARLYTGLSENEIRHHDLRRRIDLNRTFDLAFCVEVAEHIEPPFSATLIETLVGHSDLVWFSFTSGGGDGDLNHPNEQPVEFWINLFDFYGYGFHRLPDLLTTLFANRALYIFYDRKKYPSTNWEAISAFEFNLTL